MTVETTKKMMDAFYTAGRIRGLLPPLPKGIAPSYINILDAIHSLSESNPDVRISDVSQALGVARPGITRALNEMEQKDLVQRCPFEEDRRVTTIIITEKGKQILKIYSADYFQDLIQDLDQISEEDAAVTIRTIDRFYQIMRNRRRNSTE